MAGDLTLGVGVDVAIADPSITVTLDPPPEPTLAVVPIAGLPGGIDTEALQAHINAPTPHPAYDVDMQSLTVIFENGLI